MKMDISRCEYDAILNAIEDYQAYIDELMEADVGDEEDTASNERIAHNLAGLWLTLEEKRDKAVAEEDAAEEAAELLKKGE
jgi:Asp-tRNA(Asn)/Glu-tRNA(Gln) amidotransferase C subunit